MAYKISGGTLYPQQYGGYDLSPEEQQLIELALSGRQVNAGPEQSISNAYTMQDLMGRALQERQVRDAQYLQRQEDERQNFLKQQDLELQNQAEDADFARKAKLTKAGLIGRVAEAQAGAVNPMTGETGNVDTQSLANELDNILGMNQPKSTGVRPASNTITNKKGEVYDPTTGKFKPVAEGPSVKLGLKERILARQKQLQPAPASESKPITEKTPEAVMSKGNAKGESPSNLFEILSSLFKSGNDEMARQYLEELQSRNTLYAKK